MGALLFIAAFIAFIAVFVSMSNLKRRVTELEEALSARDRVAESPVEKPRPIVETPSAEPVSEVVEPEPFVATPVPAKPTGPPPLPARAAPPKPIEPTGPTLESRIKEWFTEGNVPVKIGMLVLLAGVAALLKYASDVGWLRAPIELRLAGVSAAALAGLVFGWRKREQKRVFALSLQGGAIGVLLLTVFAAFKLYTLMPASAAFALSVVLVAGLGVLAVAQDALALAVLGILAGFLAPVWLSTGGGNHVALFSYYALLNAGVFAIAWWRPWQGLNLLGFVFTFAIGTAWGVLQYDAAQFATTEPFLVLFFVFYLLLPILYARRQTAVHGDKISGALVFGAPLIAFSLQAGLFEGEDLPLAFCALGLAALYAALARIFIRREKYVVLAESWAVLAVGFATLAVPLALSTHATASLFALEGAALVWLGIRQRRLLPQLTGVLLQLSAGVAFFIGLSGSGPQTAIANATFASGLLLAISGLATAWTYWASTKRTLAVFSYLWALVWWMGTGLHEIASFVSYDHTPDVRLAFVALTAWLAAEIHRRRPLPETALTTVAGFVVAIPIAVEQAQVHQHPFNGWGVWAWGVFGLLGVRSLWSLRASPGRFGVWAQFSWWLVWPSALALVGDWVCRKFELESGWNASLLVLPFLAITWVALRRWNWLSAPLGERFASARTPLVSVYFVGLFLWWLLSLFADGSSAPLFWLPVLNPMELAQVAVLALFASWLWDEKAPPELAAHRAFLLSLPAFVTLTFITLRVVHHFGDISWNFGILSTAAAQMGLTVVWSVLGVIGWILGSRRGHRGLWLAGALLMGVVLLKLVVVDRHHLGNLPGIASFIAYGLLCTLVGYFAPAPPRIEPPAAEKVHE